MKRKNKSLARETVRVADDEARRIPSAQNGIDPYPGLVGIEIGVPYSRRFEPPFVSGHTVRGADDGEDEEDYDICQ